MPYRRSSDNFAPRLGTPRGVMPLGQSLRDSESPSSFLEPLDVDSNDGTSDT
ncbi:hypothetical protein K443DRAFT_675919, partial [Laccaria amethystina LaAM-08-1]